ncbi:hypothetical protein WMY93_011171 [Mugilogobius chulae]|uniref:Scaffolding anchor of CK1 domain-containing protein n=1 Tax=Mugilogobius chulae TaxID=88201 RepID=A0AAW0P1S8_9GOBI
MSNSHEQSLDENVVFLPVSETSPEFLYSETERLAVERLLNGGPEAFYSAAGSEHASCFLSPEEVTDITNWTQDYHLSPIPREREHWDNGLDSDYDMGYCSTYYPAFSDTPPPGLALGWPESCLWEQENSIKVYTSPPAEGEPSVREVIRQQLQKATQVIAIATDRLTDCAVIGDLHNAASRGVPVYIILNQRSTHENTLLRLWHPNIQVRVLGGKSFCSRAGRMVVGEMKDKFVLVDLQTVIHGSYSLTWSDAHLHRQLVTVLTGSVVDSFDREFRILFAASSPVPEPRRASISQITNHVNNFSDLRFPKHLPYIDAEIINPPSPPSDTLLDWEEMGPLEKHQDVFLQDKPLMNNVTAMDMKPKFMDNFFSNKHMEIDKKRFSEPPPPTSPVNNYVSHLFTSHSKTKPTVKEPQSPEMRIETRIEPMVEKTVLRQISQENTKYDKYLKRHEKQPDLLHNVNTFSHIKSRLEVKEEPTVKDETSSSRDGSVIKMENAPASRKPVILRMNHTEDTSSLSDIVNRIKQKQSTQEHTKDHSRDHPKDLLRERSQTAFSQLNRSMSERKTLEHMKDHSRDQLKDHNRDLLRERTQTTFPELNKSMLEQKTLEHVQDHSRDQLTDNTRDHPKDLLRERSQTAFPELNKSMVQQNTLEHTKDHLRDLQRDHQKDYTIDLLRERSQTAFPQLNRSMSERKTLEHVQDHSRDHLKNHQNNKYLLDLLRERSQTTFPEPTRSLVEHNSLEHTKDHLRDHLKDHTRDHPKDPLRERSQTAFPELNKSMIEQNSQEHAKDHLRDHLKDHTRDQLKDHTRDALRERSQTAFPELKTSMVKQNSQEHAKDHLRDHLMGHTRDQLKDHTRDPLRERSQTALLELNKSMVQQNTLEPTKDHLRDLQRDHQKDYTKDLLRERSQTTFPELNKPMVERKTLEHIQDHTRDHMRDHTSDPLRERSQTSSSEISRSMVELSVKSPVQDEKTIPVPRFRAGTLDVELLTPALALMQKRNDTVRTALFRSPLNFQPRDRPRSYAFGSDWKGTLSELDTQTEGH